MLSTCVKCQIQMKLDKSGVFVVKMFSDPPRPYQVWSGDLHKCPQCGVETVGGWGGRQIAEHYQEGFSDLMEKLENSDLAVVVYEYEWKTRPLVQ